MATPLPLLPVTPNAGNVATALFGNVGGVAAGTPSDIEGVFAALIAQQLATEGAVVPGIANNPLANGAEDIATSLTPNVSNATVLMKSATKVAETESDPNALLALLPAEVKNALGQSKPIADAASAIAAPSEPDPATAALARSVAATLNKAGEPAPVVVAPAEGDVVKASVIVVNEAPVPPPDEAALTDAAGGEDIAPDALNAALGAALSLGVVPQQGERLVQSAVLPTAVRSASSVRILDQLLDKLRISPPAMPSADAQPDLSGAVASPELPLDRPTPALHSGATPLPQPLFDPAPAPNQLPSGRRDGLPQPLRTDAPIVDKVRPLSTEIIPVQPAPSRTAEQASVLPTNVIAVEESSEALPTANSDVGMLERSEPRRLGADSARIVTNASVSGAGASEVVATPTKANVVREQDFHLFDADSEPSLRLATAPTARNDNAPGTVTGNAPAALAAIATGPALGNGATSNIDGGQGAQANSPGAVLSGQTIIASGSGDSSLADSGTDFLKSGQDAAGFDLSGSGVGSPVVADDASAFGTLLALGNNNVGAQIKPVSLALPHNVQLPTMPPSEVAVHIAAAARDGTRNLTIQLQPAALGRIDVELSVNREGKVKGRIQAERSETLDLLQRDARGLERALEAAGLKAETGGLSFSLKDGGRQDRQPMPNSFSRDLVMADVSSEPVAASRHAYRGAAGGGRALDIEV